MDRKISRKILISLLSLFFLSNGMCVINNLDSIWRHLANFHDYLKNNKSKRSEVSVSNKEKEDFESNHIEEYSRSLEFYNILFKVFLNRRNNRESKSGENYYFKPNRSSHKKEKNSLFHKFIISDFMFVYAMAEVLLSICLACILIPCAILLRKWIRNLRKTKFKESYINQMDAETYLQKCEKGDMCSICLDDILNEVLVIGSLSCGHSFHSVCIKEWLKRANNCPFCRQKIDSIVYIDLSN